MIKVLAILNMIIHDKTHALTPSAQEESETKSGTENALRIVMVIRRNFKQEGIDDKPGDQNKWGEAADQWTPTSVI